MKVDDIAHKLLKHIAMRLAEFLSKQVYEETN